MSQKEGKNKGPNKNNIFNNELNHVRIKKTAIEYEWAQKVPTIFQFNFHLQHGTWHTATKGNE